MGRKKKRTESRRIYCWYCERDFASEHELVHHQKEKHLKCPTCYKRMVSTSGLVVHAQQVHKRAVTVPNAIEGREDPNIDVFGMQGIPEDAHGKTKRQRTGDASGAAGNNDKVAGAAFDRGDASAPSTGAVRDVVSVVPDTMPPAYVAPGYPSFTTPPHGHAPPYAHAHAGYMSMTVSGMQPYGGPYQQHRYAQPYQGQPGMMYVGGHRRYHAHPAMRPASAPPRNHPAQQSSYNPPQTQKPGPSSNLSTPPAVVQSAASYSGVHARAQDANPDRSAGRISAEMAVAGSGGVKLSGPSNASAVSGPASAALQTRQGQKSTVDVVFDRQDMSMEELRARLPRYRTSLLHEKIAENKS